MALPRPLVLGNWKMNGLRRDGERLAGELARRLREQPGSGTLGICPPATLLHPLAATLDGSGVLLGGQDCHGETSGAFTGDVAAAMLTDAGCAFTLVGHSERRHGHGEDDATVHAKAQAALGAGLIAVVCIGETEQEWLDGRTLERLDAQIKGSMPQGADAGRLVVAYEPVWAIGTGRTPETADIARTHAHIRSRLRERAGGEAIPILYGGSVKAANAGEILALADVDGVLVGGASLKADEFWSIYTAGAAR